MTLKRFSLFYLAGYLLPTGLGLMLAPQLVFKLLFSSGEYGDVIPRLAGGLVFALGLVVANIIWRDVDTLYPALIGARVVLCGLVIALYAQTSDPFFLVLLVAVGSGVVLTSVGLLRDRTRAASAR